MKKKDYRTNVDIYDAEIDRLKDALTDTDYGTETYSKICKDIAKLSAGKLLEERCYSEYKEHMIPDCVPKLLSVAATTGLAVMIYIGEMKGGVIGSTASTLLNKLKF